MRRLACLLLCCLLSLSACDEPPEQILPEVRVEFSIPLSLPEFQHLTIQGNVMLIKQHGYNQNGVYIAHELLDKNRFSAYDATCIMHLDKPASTKLDGTTAKCVSCNREYELLNNAITPDAQHQLQRYRADYINGTIIVRNR